MAIEDLQFTDSIATEEEDSLHDNLWNDVYCDQKVTRDILNSATSDATPDSKSVGPEEMKRRQEKVFSDPKVKEFMEDYKKVLESGKLDEKFLKSAREIGKKCLEDYDSFYFLWHKLNDNGVHLSADKNGVTFSRTEYLGTEDSLGHPTVPYGQVFVDLKIPFDGKSPRGTTISLIQGAHLEKLEPADIGKDEAAQRVFKPTPVERPRRYFPIEPLPL